MRADLILHGYFRSSAAWRVRIALALKGVSAEPRFRHLRRGEQRAADYLALNPQGLLPALEIPGVGVLTQSLAIIEWLEETRPEPALLPRDAYGRARVRAFAYAVAAEIHAVQNLKVLTRVRAIGGDAEAWAREVIGEGLAACEVMAAGAGPFCFGATPTLADLCLIPQLYNARRFAVALEAMPRLLAAEAACLALPQFADTAPDGQPDAE